MSASWQMMTRLMRMMMPEEKPISLAPLDLEQALGGLMKVKPPEKPEKKPKRKEAPPPTRSDGA